ncbi:MAG: hypothetical protein Hyperionvirus3_101 [Hyperionvirus sp.]|uniref:Uncharacterized protein n=1 Tax=Hyperionvirus sp. TaxID=2487770 RepID=A0A3G5A6T7_9VIRU|nr:MAG: hypothetical protein Hyperionvirus3_101 [Hyperionvirus sp.]
MSEGTVKASLAIYREMHLRHRCLIAQADYLGLHSLSLQADIAFLLEAKNTVRIINQSLHQSLVANELKGITINPSTRGQTCVYFDGTHFGLSIINPVDSFNYAETRLLRKDVPADAATTYHHASLKCINYEDIRRFDDEKELISDLIRLRDFFRSKTIEEIDLQEGSETPKLKKASPRRQNYRGGNRRRQRGKTATS